MRKAKDDQVLLVLKKLQEIYKTNFTMEGLVNGHQNFEMEGGEFQERFNMLLDAVAEGNMPESTHGTVLSALVLFYVYSRKHNLKGFGAIHNMFEEKENK